MKVHRRLAVREPSNAVCAYWMPTHWIPTNWMPAHRMPAHRMPTWRRLHHRQPHFQEPQHLADLLQTDDDSAVFSFLVLRGGWVGGGLTAPIQTHALTRSGLVTGAVGPLGFPQLRINHSDTSGPGQRSCLSFMRFWALSKVLGGEGSYIL